MGVIKDVADEFVIDTIAIIEFWGFHDSIRELLSYLCFNVPKLVLNDGLIELVPNNEDVDPAVGVFVENPRNRNDLDVPCSTEA